METKLTFLRDSKNFPEVLNKSIFVLNKLEIEFSLLPGAKFTFQYSLHCFHQVFSINAIKIDLTDRVNNMNQKYYMTQSNLKANFVARNSLRIS